MMTRMQKLASAGGTYLRGNSTELDFPRQLQAIPSRVIGEADTRISGGARFKSV